MSEEIQAPERVERDFRWLPNFRLSILLLVVWLLLNNTVAPGHLVLGSIIAIIIPWLTQPLMTPRPGIRKFGLAFRYLIVLLYDIVRSNIQVALLICKPMRSLRPGMLAIPLELKDELSITILASTISLTPGTVSAEISEDRHWLYVHALHVEDEASTIARIKHRYERPLREIY